MFVSPINFCASFTLQAGKDISHDEMAHEIEYANRARNVNVNVPNYYVNKFSKNGKTPEYVAKLEYQTDGEIADFYKNPITKLHLNSLFDNLFLLDKNNISHNDLDKDHVFYDKNGKVQFDCFRFADNFIKDSKKNYALPSFVSPSNQFNYESASLGFYLKQMPSQKDKINFMETYLFISSLYHQRRAEIAKDEMNANYENLQARLFREADEEMADLALDRVCFLTEQRKAFTEWDEGNGACGHEFSAQRRRDAIPMYLDCICHAIDYSEKAKTLSLKSKGIKAQYYNYESMVGEYLANTYISWVEGMADYNFTDVADKSRNVCPVDDETRAILREEYGKIIKYPIESKKTAIKEYKELYNACAKI